jgi:DNA gyrase subunit A
MVIGATRPVSIVEEMRSAYLDYAMSVIVSRALPDVRDGLKPVHRRILYGMRELGLAHNSAYKKSARIVGEVLGKYHPHGDTSVYDAMVRMAQDFSMRYLLVDGQGNFGSVDNDPPAAMRYTEARLTEIAEQMLLDIDKNTVDFVPNFDNSLTEPSILPTRLPNLLVNGSSGIAVGMATNIPPHNLTEVCDAIIYLIDNPEATVNELTQFVKGPDFPTAGIIMGLEGIQNAYATGYGRVVIQARAHISDAQEGGGRRQIIISELPYQVNKAALVEKIADLVKDKRVTGIAELRDESDRQGMRIVIELKREAQPQMVLNTLYKYTAMQSSFFINMLALVDGQPRVISLKEALQYFIDFRRVVIIRRSKFELKQAKDRAHILEGLKIALDYIDEVVKIIRQAKNTEAARYDLRQRFSLSEIQAQAILDMQLRRLANLERQKILDEYAEIIKTISYLEDLLANSKKILALVKEETEALKEKFGDVRRTQISEAGITEFHVEDLIPHQKVAVTLSHRGFIKRVPVQAYTPQHRGGKGIIGHVTREEDALRLLTVADTHDNMLFFTNKGRVFSLKCYEIPDVSRTGKGTAVINLFPIMEGEKVTAMVDVTNFPEDHYLVMITRLGEIKKTRAENFASVRTSGIIAIDLPQGDELVDACITTDKDDALVVTKKGKANKFSVSELRTASRTSGGVRGVRVAPGDQVVSMDIAYPDTYLLVVTTGGYGKLTAVEEYPRHHRGGGGVLTFKVIEKTGEVAAARVVTQKQQLMIISAEGIVINTPVKEKDPTKGGISVQHRTTQGVRLMRLDPGDKAVSITCFEKTE